MTNPLDDVDQYLMGGGGGAPSAFNKFDGPGTRRGGRIVKRELTQQTEFGTNVPLWFDKEETKPRKQVEITVETELRDPERDEDNGHRRIFIKGSYLEGELREAIKTARAPGVQIGGQLYVTRLRQVQRASKKGNYDDWDVKIDYIPAPAEVDAHLLGADANGNGAALAQNGGAQNGAPAATQSVPTPGMAPGSGYTSLPATAPAPAQVSQQSTPAPAAPATTPEMLTEAELLALNPDQRASVVGMIAAGQITAATARIVYAAQLQGVA